MRTQSPTYRVSLTVLTLLGLLTIIAPARASEAPVPRGTISNATALLALPGADGAGPEAVARSHGDWHPSSTRHKHGKVQVVGVLNLNRASEAELQLLPGIGKTRAALIVERRSKRPYASVDEVARLRGMRKIVQRLRAHLSVKGDTTLRPVEP